MGKSDNKTSVNWYTHGARYYDPQLARWHCSDPLSELYASSSPYGYVINNPINFVDPDGMRRDPAPYARDNYTSLLSDGYNRTPFENSFSFMRASGGWYYDNDTQTYSNFFGGSKMSASSFNNDITPSFGGTLSSEATQAVIDGMNSLIASMSSVSGNINMNRSWNLPLVMAFGFDNNIFQFDRESGSFYAPWTDIQVDPLAILIQSLAPNSASNDIGGASEANYWLGLSTTLLGGSRGFGYSLNTLSSMQQTSDVLHHGLDYTKEITRTTNVIRGLKIGGVLTSSVSLAFSYNSWKSGNLSNSKFALDAGMTLYSHVPIIGWAAGLQYHIIDTFYPGGVPGFSQDYAKQQMEFQDAVGYSMRSFMH